MSQQGFEGVTLCSLSASGKRWVSIAFKGRGRHYCVCVSVEVSSSVIADSVGVFRRVNDRDGFVIEEG